jgi:cell division protein FtsI (penicillin-binding protein 3)
MATPPRRTGSSRSRAAGAQRPSRPSPAGRRTRPAGRGAAPPPRPPRRPRRRRRQVDPGRRLQAILILSLFVLSLIAGRLLQLQGLQRTAYSTDATDQRLHTIALTAARGRILDADGHVLADTVAADDIDATPSLVVDAQRTAQRLAPLLHLGVRALVTKLEVTGGYANLAHAVSPDLAHRITALQLPGIYAAATTKRVYPNGSLASNVIGAVGTDGGLSGLEYSQNSLLSGHNGSQTYEVGINGAPIPDAYSHTVPARPGASLQLSLNRDIQWEAQQAAAAEMKASDARGVQVIVMNPHDGHLLALAEAPSYNLNDPANLTSEKLADPLATSAYEPGSVNKVITMSAALEDHLVTPTTPFVVPPVIYQGGSAFHDAEPHGYEHLTLTGILAQSSNIGTIEVARKLGAARLDKFLLAYGYDKTTSSGLPGEGTGDLPPLSQWSGTTLPTVAFGQGVNVTALQVASVYSTIANGGVRVTPNLVESTISPDGKRTPAAAPARTRVISPHVAHELRDMLEAVTTSEGTAPQAQIQGYRVAGKTGTANEPNPNGPGYLAGAYTGSFVGFAPADKPRLVVEVVVHDPRKGLFYGADVAAPVFHNVMSFALQTLHIPPTGTKAPKAKITW